MGQRGGGLGILQFDKGSWGGEGFLELSTRVEHLHLRARHRHRGWGPVAWPDQAVVLLLSLMGIRKDFAGGGLAGMLFVIRVLCLFVLRRLAQRQGLLSQEV